MAVHGPDYKLIIDRDGNGGITRRLELVKGEHPLNTADWSSERAAAATSLSAWLSFVQQHDSAGYAWLSGLDTDEQEGLRQALLKGA